MPLRHKMEHAELLHYQWLHYLFGSQLLFCIVFIFIFLGGGGSVSHLIIISSYIVFLHAVNIIHGALRNQRQTAGQTQKYIWILRTSRLISSEHCVLSP